MGMLHKIKQNLIFRAVKKRKKNSTFDDVASEFFELSETAKTDQNNSYYFTAHSLDGRSFFLRLGKRGGGEHEVWFAFLDKASKVAFVNHGSYTAETCPIKLTCVEPLKEWHIEFAGNVERATLNGNILKPNGESLEAKFCAKFFCTEKLYEFSRDSSEMPFARAVAAEKWSKEFFAALKQNTQVHTEQAGNLTGTLVVEGKTFEISAPALRDHSFGKREWGYMNRHIWLAAVSQNQHFNLSRVSYPALFELKTGYQFCNGTLTNVVDAPSMWDTSNTAELPKEFVFDVEMENGKTIKCRCVPEVAFLFLMGGDYLIFEGIAEFEIDGTVCRGIAEFGFNTTETRWKK